MATFKRAVQKPKKKKNNMTWKKLKKHDREEEKEENGAQMNNSVELGFLKIFYCLTKKKVEIGILVGIII
jgi:hypothetical protein